jgi:hypothetical protein
MQMRNLRRGAVERYAPGGAGTYTTGAYCVAFPPNLDNPIDVYYSPYIQNCTNQSGPWLKDGTMMIPNQTIQIPKAAGTSSWVADSSSIIVTLSTGTIEVGMAVNDAANEGYRNAQLLLKRNREFLQRQVVGYVEDTFPTLEYDQAKCYRDVGYIIDAVSGDARFGGNKRSIEAGLAYWSGATSLIPTEISQTSAAVQYLKAAALKVIVNEAIATVYNDSYTQIIDTNLDKGQVVSTRVTESFNTIIDIINGGEDAIPTAKGDLLGLIYPTGLSPNAVNVASTITAITTVSNNVYEVTLSSPTVSPSDNATIYFGYTSVYPFLDADIPTEWTAADADGIFADRRLDPTGSGGGALVDGNAPSLRSPIQSFVFDAFTQLNQGGNGIHIINNGYAQLVSVFTIMCSNAVIVENGGIASITNSNSNFGDTCLTAKGLGKLAFQGFVKNPPYPTNVPNGEYYPLGYWPRKQQMEVFIPDNTDRPHIGQVMEVVAPDSYIDYSGNRIPYVNEAGYPGYLISTANTSSLSTGTYVLHDIDVTNVAVGHTLYVRDVYGSESAPGQTTPYVTTGTQVVDVNYQSVTLDRPILSGYADASANFFNLYFCGNAYYTVLSSTIDDSLASTVTNQVTLVPGQETTTSLAISYAKNLALRAIQNIPASGFVYNKTKCARDTGIIVDSIITDLLFPDNGYTQSNFAGLQYWNQGGYTGSIAGELTTTTNAINYVSDLAQRVILNVTTGTRYQSTVTQNVGYPAATSVEVTAIATDFAVITNILTTGTAGVTDIVVANGIAPVSVEAQRAYDILQANKAYIQREAVAFVEATKDVGFEYDSALCYRDVGYMIDSVAFDVLYGGNRQAIQSGVYYYGFSDSSSAIPGEKIQTVAAYERMKQILGDIVTNTTISKSPNNTLTQITNLTASTSSVGTTIGTMVDKIKTIITSGPDAADAKTAISQTISSDQDTLYAVDILAANRDFVKAEIISFIDKEYGTGFVYDQAKCARDTGLIVDAISLDLLYPTAEYSQSNFAGLQYWNQDKYIDQITSEITTTTNAVRYIKEIAQLVVQGITTGTRYQSTVTQNVSADPATSVEAEFVANDFDIILDILVDGIAGVTDKIIPNGVVNTATDVVNAFTLLTNNKSYIQAETIAYIDANNTFDYDRTTCRRDIGYMIDSVAFDLLHGGNKQAIQSGVYYYGYDAASSAIAGEVPQTTQAYNYIKEIVPYIVKSISTTTNQDYVTQVTDLDPATDTEVDALQAYIDHIVQIINTGPSAANDKTPISLSQSVEPGADNAYALLQANRDFIKAQTLAFIDANNPTGTYQTEISQVFDAELTGGEDAVGSVRGLFDIISGIVKNGADSSPAIQRPRQYVDSNQNILNAKRLLEKNRQFIQAETVAYVDSIWPSKFSYDPIKCSRDTGLIVDALSQDLLFNGTSQSTFAGIQYWNQSETVIPGEETTTTRAISYLKSLAEKVVVNNTSTYRYQNTFTQVTSTVTSSTSLVVGNISKDFNVILDILSKGTDGITDKIVPNSLIPSTTTSTLAGYNLLQANKEYLQHEVVAYVDASSNLVYDQAKCARDTGLIVDSLALDLLYPTTWDSQSTFAGIQYWNQSGYVGDIANEITTTTNAITYLSGLAAKVVVNNITGTRYQSTVTQTTSSFVATPTEAAIIGADFGVIIDILTDGTDGVTDIIVPNGRRSISTVTNYAYNLLLANKNYLVAETIAYVESTKSVGFVYDQSKCVRDVGYMVDSVAFDLLHGGNKQAVQSGVYYYGYNSTSTAVPNEQPAVTAAYTRLKEILPSIVAGVAIIPSYGTTENQVTYMLPANSTQGTKLQTKIDTILNIINNGPGVANTLTSISLTPSTDVNADRAYDLLMANREFIKDEIVSYINSNFTGFVYDKAKCFRDVGYMVDSVSFDLLYGGNRQAIQSGVYYYGYDATSTAIPKEIPQTTEAYNFIESIVEDIVTGTLITAPQQTTVPQVISTSTGTVVEATLIKNNVNLINNIIEYGPDEVTVKEPISLTSNTSTNVVNAAKLLNANRDFIRAETLAFINNTFNTGFLYDKTKCKRDTGLIVDSIAFDLLYEGVTESTFAGLQYWNQDTYTGSVKGEITTTTNAIRYIKELVRKVIVKEDVVVTAGNTSTQITNLTAGTANIATLVTNNVQIILDILTKGTSGVTDIIEPNSVASTSTDVTSSYDLLQANKEFIQEEVIARINYDNSEFEYDRVTCKRDVGYIIDSLSFDLLHGGNRQSVTSGVYYYGFDANDTVIDDQVPQTTAAYNYIREIVAKIIKGEQLLKLYQRKVPQIILNTVGSDAEVTLAQAKVDTITDIINNGPEVAPVQQPISATASSDTNVQNAFNILIANRAFIQAEVIAMIDYEYTDAPNYDRTKCYRDMAAIVDAVAYDLTYGGNYNAVNTGNGYFNRKGQYHIVKLEQNVTDPTLFVDGATVRFYQQSYISASGYLFEYVGAGTQYGALPQVGTADPQQSKEVVQLNNGKVFFTSTDQNGDFRIGTGLVISQATGVLTGRTFEKSLYAQMTPFILVVGA